MGSRVRCPCALLEPRLHTPPQVPWHDPSKIASLGRKTLLIAGVLTEVAIQNTALSGVERGYDVQLVMDACGGISPKTEDAALRRLLRESSSAIFECGQQPRIQAAPRTDEFWPGPGFNRIRRGPMSLRSACGQYL